MDQSLSVIRPVLGGKFLKQFRFCMVDRLGLSNGYTNKNSIVIDIEAR